MAVDNNSGLRILLVPLEVTSQREVVAEDEGEGELKLREDHGVKKLAR